MQPEDRLSDVLAEFARTLATDFPIQGILDHLVRRIVDILPIEAAGVSLISATTEPQQIAGSDRSATRYEHLQTALGEGPCLTAYQTMGPVAVPDLRHDGRFPQFTERALAEGLVAVFSFPLRQEDHCLGALDLYRTSAGPLSEADMAAAQTLAAVATAYLLNAQARVAKTEFVAALSHELRTPMTSIAGFTELLLDEDGGHLSPDQADFVHAISHNSDRLLLLADDLLTLSGLDSITGAHAPTQVDLGLVVTDAHAAMFSLIGRREVEVRVEVPSDPVMVLGDAHHLESMVSNLIGNALKFTTDGGWVRCTLRAVDGKAHVVVRDNGIGVPEAEQARLFTRFYRSSSARERGIQGSGLGLTIVASVAHQHGGEVSFVSAHLGGSTFTATIPLTQGAPA